MACSEPPRKLIEAALLLVGRSHCGNPDSACAAQRELAQWRASPPERRAALETAERLWAATDGRCLQSEVPPPPRRDRARARRNALGLLGAGGLAGLLWGGGRWYWQQPVFALALQTGRAQQRDQPLPDGSELTLAPHTRAQVVLYRDRREVQLAQGEMRFRVAGDADRPFTVVSEWGRVRVLGTVFGVSVRAGRMRVEVAEGQVAVWAGAEALTSAVAPALTLTRGQAVEVDEGGPGQRQQVMADHVGAWRSGWLVFNDTPLDQALARWNDYLQRPMRLGRHPRLRQLRLSGSFPLRQPQAFIAGLPDMLPVKLLRNDAGEVMVEMR